MWLKFKSIVNSKFRKKTKNEIDPYLIAIIIIAIALSWFFYLFWVNGHILRQSDASSVHLALFVEYFKERTVDFQSFIPNNLNDFFPTTSPVVTTNFTLLFFPLFNSYKYLILTKILAIEISVIVFYLLSKLYLSRAKAFLVTILYATSPFTIFTILHDYKPDILALPFIFLIFYAWKKGNYKTFLFSSIFLVLTRQHFMPFLVLFGIYLYIKDQNKKFALTSLVVGALSTIIYLGLLIKFPILNAGIIGNWGYGIFEILANPEIIINNIMGTYWEVLNMFPYFLFLPLLVPEILFLALPMIFDNLMSAGFYRYSNEIVLTIPFLFIALLFAIKRTERFLNKIFSMFTAKIILSTLLLSILIINFASITFEILPQIKKYEGAPTLNCGCCDFYEGSLKDRYNSLTKIIEIIPEGAKVISPSNVKLFLLEEDIAVVRHINEADILIRDMCMYECNKSNQCMQFYRVDLGNHSFESLNRSGDFALMKKLKP